MSRRNLIAISVAAIAVTGLALILASAFYQPFPHAVLWYWQDGKVYRYDTETRESEEVKLPAEGWITSAQLSPDGQYVAFSDREGLKIAPRPFTRTDLIAKHKTSTDGAKTITTSYTLRGWSPDSRSFLVEEAGWDVLIYRASVVDRELGPLLSAGTSTSRYPGHLSWSSDGRQLAAPSWGMGPGGDSGGVLIADVDGSKFHRIYYEKVHAGPMVFEGGVKYVAWSPVEESIAFVQAFDFQPDRGYQWKLMAVKSNGTKAQTIVETDSSDIAEPVWSPDGTTLYYLLRHFENFEDDIYSVNLLSHKTTRLHSASHIFFFSVSPDAAWIAFAQDEGVIRPDMRMWLLNLKTPVSFRVIDRVVGNIWDAGFAGWEMVP